MASSRKETEMLTTSRCSGRAIVARVTSLTILTIALAGAPGAARAQTYKVLHAFTHSDGDTPWDRLTQDIDGNLYGVTRGGGASGGGVVYRITRQGVVTVLHSFPSDGGGLAWGPIVGGDGNLYGTTAFGGPNGGGTIFRLSTNGSSFTIAHEFPPTAQGSIPVHSRPKAGLVRAADGNLYGTLSSSDSPDGTSTIYRFSTDGLYTGFTFTSSGAPKYMAGPLFQANDGFLYGASTSGGQFGTGTVFRFAGSGLTVLHDVALFGEVQPAGHALLFEGANGSVYGISKFDGATISTAFRLDSSGSYTTIHSFDDVWAGPQGGLTLGTDGRLYGVKDDGVFAMNPAGDVTIVHAFTGSPDGNQGGNLESGVSRLLQATNGAFYGVTACGGSSANNNVCSHGGFGTVFKIGLPWAYAFDGGDAAAPWIFPDWSFGEYKAECPFARSLPLGLSAWPTWAGDVAGAAHSVLCKEPLAAETDSPFLYYQARTDPFGPPAAVGLTSAEVVEPFYAHDSPDVGSRHLPQFPNDDWDQGHYKGQCPADDFITGISQTGNWSAPADDGGTKPPYTVDKILCSHVRCDSPSRPYRAGNTCTTHSFPGDDPASLPDGDWANQFYKVECGASEVMVGVSVDTTTHRPHKILCCQLELLIC
jgi:uncharacterized repeat protein (TIGR03803 family)